VVTYHINPRAVWDDGQPITSRDFRYTWDQVAHGKDVNDRTGYQDIGSVDGSDPHTAVVTFAQTFADWKYLFGGLYGIFPSHLLESKDRDTMMKDGYTFSGGPWKLAHWIKGTEVTLVPNVNYWGKEPNLSSVTFKFITDTAAEQQDYKTGQISAFYPQAQPGGEALRASHGTFHDAIPGLSFEGVWFDVDHPPLNSKAVRQALAYATDRVAIVKQLFSAIEPNIKPINSFFTPAFGKVYTEPFARYRLDLKAVNQLMTSDGWTKGSDGLWAKGSTKATLELKTTGGNKRRQLTAEILQNEWRQAGFGLTITLERAGVFFKDLGAGNFQVGVYAQNPYDSDPGSCNLWCSKNIPSSANGYTGENFDRIIDPGLDQPWLDADTSLDQNARITDAQRGQQVLADLVPAIPIDPFPDIIVVNGDRIGVEGGMFKHNFAYGPFTYMNTWYSK
jgi:peptide/nickel transport system substrate-binding protein